MTGIVLVSHSATLAEAVRALAGQLAPGQVRIAAAGGTADPANPFGTDAVKVQEAIESVWSEDGVLVLMDLGSAVLSAETALEFLDESRRDRVRLCPAPLVEGAVAAVTLALAGAGLAEIEREARQALSGKEAQIGAPAPGDAARPASQTGDELVVKVRNRLGLHARPAVRLVRAAGRFPARVTLRNRTTGAGPANAASINAVLALGARQGHEVAVAADGPDAERAKAALAALIDSGLLEEEPAAPYGQPESTPREAPEAAGVIQGVPASPGIATGPLRRFHPAPAEAVTREAGDPAGELERLRSALDAARTEIRALRGWAARNASEKEAAIFDAHLLFLDDPSLVGAAAQGIREGQSADVAWRAAAEETAARFRELDDPYLRARAADIVDVGARVSRALAGAQTVGISLAEPAVIAAGDVSPSDIKALHQENLLGLCLEAGSASAHSIILARALGIPAVVGLGPAIGALADGSVVGLDGREGKVWVAPDAALVHRLEEGRAAWLAGRASAQAAARLPAVTRDGRRIGILANVNDIAGVTQALDFGAEGIGVLRTEFLFLDRDTAPDEEEQLAAYHTVAGLLGPHPLVIRTLDAGGDKNLPYLDIGAEANPFLGWRGLRLTLGQPDLLKTQFRAILRASPGRQVEVLLPMVASMDELHSAKALLALARAELTREGVAFDENIKLGIMVEVPAAVAIADQLAAEVGFFSIGTNDLAQYAMAADRTNPRVASAADACQPAVLRLIRDTVRAARAAGIGVTLCGELASDPLAAPLLVGLGLTELSLGAPLIPEVKQAIARTSVAEAEEIAAHAMTLGSGEAVRRYLRERGV